MPTTTRRAAQLRAAVRDFGRPHNRLVVFTAAPGSEDAERLRLLSVVGNQSFAE